MSDYDGDNRAEIAERQHAQDVADLEHRFAYHPPSTDSRRVGHERVRAGAHAFALDLLHLVPPSRERSLALTAIEEAMMWGNAGIARHYADEAGPRHAQIVGDPVPLRDRTAGSLGLTGQQVEPDPVGETQNPASLVGTQDMPAPEGSDVPEQPAAPQRNVTEPAEAPHVPSVAPQHAGDPMDERDVMVPTTDGGTIAFSTREAVERAATEPFPGARWDVERGAWETPAGQPDPAIADPDVSTSP